MDPKSEISAWIFRGLVVSACVLLSLQACCALPVDVDRTKRATESGMFAIRGPSLQRAGLRNG